MTKVAVIGATGRQGGAVAELLLDHGHEVVAYVRSAESPAARALSARGALIASGDLGDPDALQRACAGTDAVFGLSVPFGEGGKDEEVAQGRLLVDTVTRLDAHLVYSSVRGGDRTVATNVDHADSKQLIEAYLREQPVAATVLGPVYFMENALNLGFSRLGDGVLANPLTPGKPLDQVTVLDIAGMAVYAIENPGELVGERVDIASDRVSGEEAARVLSEILGRDVPYQQRTASARSPPGPGSSNIRPPARPRGTRRARAGESHQGRRVGRTAYAGRVGGLSCSCLRRRRPLAAVAARHWSGTPLSVWLMPSGPLAITERRISVSWQSRTSQAAWPMEIALGGEVHPVPRMNPPCSARAVSRGDVYRAAK
ncbi:NmrA family NAD(P)-binding protein [Nonomuraea sp. NPDC049158]|uniref:NmrA family NAD(P)-binding protein n=1 Tax=Nonomuraea sp. NPDC049158 TaxID=3155649 RepID=UPI00340476FD